MEDGLKARHARKLRSEQRLAAVGVPAVAVEELSLGEEREGVAARVARRARIEQRAAAEKAKHDADEAERLQRVAAACEKRRAERVANGEVGPEAKRKKAAEKEAKRRADLEKDWNDRAEKWRNATEQEEVSKAAAEEERRKWEEANVEAEAARLVAAQERLVAEERRVKIWLQTGQNEATASRMHFLGEERSETVMSWGWQQLENGTYGYGQTRGGDQVSKTLRALGIENTKRPSGGVLALQDQDGCLALEDAGSTAPCSPTPIAAAQAAVMPAAPAPVSTAAPVEAPPAEVTVQWAAGEDGASPVPHGTVEAEARVPARAGCGTGGGAGGQPTAGDWTPRSDASDHSEREMQSTDAGIADGFEVGVGNGVCHEHPGGGEVSTTEVSITEEVSGRSAREARQLARCLRIADAAAARRARISQRWTRRGTICLADGLGPHVAREPG